MNVSFTTSATPPTATVPVARLQTTRSSGRFATYRDYTLMDRLNNVEPTYSGDHGKQVRTGLTPATAIDASALVTLDRAGTKPVAGSLDNAIDAALALANEARPDKDHVTPAIGVVLRSDAPDAWQIGVGTIAAPVTDHDVRSNLTFAVTANRTGGASSARAGFELLDGNVAAIAAGSSRSDAVITRG
jgi:hypothetical protein